MIVDWDRKIVELFSEFSSIDYQRLAWFNKLDNIISSPDEMINNIDDLDVEGWLSSNSQNIDRDLSRRISRFCERADHITVDLHDARKTINDPEWAILVRDAGSIYEELIRVFPFDD